LWSAAHGGGGLSNTDFVQERDAEAESLKLAIRGCCLNEGAAQLRLGRRCASHKAHAMNDDNLDQAKGADVSLEQPERLDDSGHEPSTPTVAKLWRRSGAPRPGRLTLFSERSQELAFAKFWTKIEPHD